jgi:uncharacterized membrane protein (DUF2068 family)
MPDRPPPGTIKPRRFVPRFHWELLACGVAGHELLGTDSKSLRAEDAIFARDEGEIRWHRCLRCDSWLPLKQPVDPPREHPPNRMDVRVPPRGRALRDKIVLRAIAIDRALHFVVLAALAILILIFAAHQADLRKHWYPVLVDIQKTVGGGPVEQQKHGLVHQLDRLFSLDQSTIRLAALGIGLYAILEGVEAIGLWLQKRWAEYLTLIATALFLPWEIYELTHRVSPFKIIALIVNSAVIIYLLFAKRLFGLRGGALAEHIAREADAGWASLERTAPPSALAASAGSAPR